MIIKLQCLIAISETEADSMDCALHLPCNRMVEDFQQQSNGRKTCHPQLLDEYHTCATQEGVLNELETFYPGKHKSIIRPTERTIHTCQLIQSSIPIDKSIIAADRSRCC